MKVSFKTALKNRWFLSLILGLVISALIDIGLLAFEIDASGKPMIAVALISTVVIFLLLWRSMSESEGSASKENQ